MNLAAKHPVVERTLLAAALLLFALPLLIGMVYAISNYLPPRFRLEGSVSLGGTQLDNPVIPFSIRSLLSGAYQESLAARFNKGLPGRHFLIRFGCELWYRLFRASAVQSVKIVVGRHSYSLRGGLSSGILPSKKALSSDLAPLAVRLKCFQDVCKRRGIHFSLVLTPSKAALFPELIPPRWLASMDLRPRSYDLFVPLLQQQGVCFVDGHAITVAAKSSASVPVFPKGGTHWGDYPALLTSEALLQALGVPGPRSIGNARASMNPSAVDRDLIHIMNLAIPWNFPVSNAQITREIVPPERQQSVVFVGGSFMWRMAEMFSGTNRFSRVDCFYYYRTWKASVCDGAVEKIREPTGEVNFVTEVFAANNIVIEMNEATINAPAHVTAFLDAAFQFDRDHPSSSHIVGPRPVACDRNVPDLTPTASALLTPLCPEITVASAVSRNATCDSYSPAERR